MTVMQGSTSAWPATVWGRPRQWCSCWANHTGEMTQADGILCFYSKMEFFCFTKNEWFKYQWPNNENSIQSVLFFRVRLLQDLVSTMSTLEVVWEVMKYKPNIRHSLVTCLMCQVGSLGPVDNTTIEYRVTRRGQARGSGWTALTRMHHTTSEVRLSKYTKLVKWTDFVTSLCFRSWAQWWNSATPWLTWAPALSTRCVLHHSCGFFWCRFLGSTVLCKSVWRVWDNRCREGQDKRYRT